MSHITRLKDAKDVERVLYTGIGTNGTLSFQLKDSAGNNVDITGTTIKMRVMDRLIANEVVAEQSAVITDAVNGKFDIDLTGITIATPDIQDNAVAVFFDDSGGSDVVLAQKFVDIVEGGND